MSAPWRRTRLSLSPVLAAFLEERLVGAGFENLVVERRPDQKLAELSIYVPAGVAPPDAEALSSWLAEAESAELPDRDLELTHEELTERDWMASFRQRFARQKASDRVEIVAPWEMEPRRGDPPRPAPGSAAPLTLIIEPGQAFGTGEHPTTRACLEQLADWVIRRGDAPFDCLDLGSGTGILSLATLFWGARRVEGYDIDAASIVNAYLNADLNGLAGRLRFRWGEPRQLEPEGWDLALCNIFLGPLLRLIPRLDRALRPGGGAILSGFLTEQAGRIDEGAQARGWEKLGEGIREDWVVQEWRKTAS